MSDNREIETLIVDIRVALSSPDSSTVQQISSLAEKYSEFSEKINARLLDATSKLKRGLVSEAFHSIELKPDALNGAALLELGDLRKSWISLCALSGITIVGPLTELAQELNRAYNDFTRTAPLIRTHRMLALTRAPLQERIAVLRKLLHEDSLNPSWKSQLQSLESARFEQIESEARHATEKANLQALRSLLSELESKDRTIAAPLKTLSFVKACMERVQRYVNMKRASEIATELHEVRAESDWEQAIVLLKELDSISGTQSGENPVDDAVNSIRYWASAHQAESERQRDFSTAIETLERAMDEGSDFGVIERIHAQAARMEIPIPKAVEQRYLQRRRQSELDRARRHRIIAVATILVASCVGVLITRTLNKRAYEAEVAKWVRELGKSVNESDFDAAAKLVSEVRSTFPDIANSPEVLALIEQTDAGADKERERRDAFRAALEEMRKAKGFEYSSPAVIARAKGLVKGDEEAMLFQAERARLDQERSIDQQVRDEPFRRARNDLIDRLAAASKLSGAEKSSELRAVAEDLNRLLESAGVSDAEIKAAQSARDAAIAEATLIDEAALRERSLLADLDRLPNAAKSVSELTAAYRKFVDEYPESAQAVRIDAALQNRRAWEHIDSFTQAVASWPTTMIPESKEEIVLRAAMLDAFVATISESPDASAFREYLEVLKHYASLDAPPREALGLTSVRDLLSQSWLTDLRTIRDSSGRLYYSIGGLLKPMSDGFYSLSGYVRTLEDLANENGSTKNAILQPRRSASGEPTTEPAPIVELAANMRNALLSHDSNTIDSTHITLAELVLRDTMTDPILRLVLLTDLLQHHRDAGRPDIPAINQFLVEANALAEQGTRVTDLDWTNTSDASIQRGRELAARLISNAPKFASIQERWRNIRSASQKALRGFQPIGAVWPSEDGSLTVKTPRLTGAGQIYVITGDERRLTVRSVGRIDNDGSVQFEGNTPELGTPVFFRKVDPTP